MSADGTNDAAIFSVSYTAQKIAMWIFFDTCQSYTFKSNLIFRTLTEPQTLDFSASSGFQPQIWSNSDSKICSCYVHYDN